MKYVSQMMNNQLSKACIWTIKNHDYLSGQIRLYTWAASATILFLSFVNQIHIMTALKALFAGSIGIFFLIWIMIIWRRERLLKISDPVLRQKAYAAMLEFLASRQLNPHETVSMHNRYQGNDLFFKK